jgi:hypothetical protein
MKKINFHVWLILSSSTLALMLSGCGVAKPTVMPTSNWHPLPTRSYHIPPSDVTEYTHYVTKAFETRLEFDYPSYWWFEERVDEGGRPDLLLRDPRFLTLPTPFDDMHPVPNDFGYIYIWPILGESEQTPDARIEFLKQAYSNTPRMKVLRDYRVKVDGYDASVLEYQDEDWETSTSLMFCRRIDFIVNGQLYEILFNVAEKDRGGEFDKGYEYFLNSLQIVP